MHRSRRLTSWLVLALAASLVLLACPNNPPPEPETVLTPTFSPQGGEYLTAQTVFLSCATPGAEIRFTVDGTDPTLTDSQKYEPDGIRVMNNLTLKAKAFKDGMNPSHIGSMDYTILDYPAQVPTPDFLSVGVSLPSGIFTSTVQVEPQCDFGPVNFIYTTDGSEPTSAPLHGTQWAGGYITVSRRTTLKMIASYANATPVIADSEVKEAFCDVFGTAANVGNAASAHSALCLDSAGKRHIVYWSDPVPNESDKLMYTTDAGGSWLSTPEVVYTLGAVTDMNWQWMAIGVTSTGDVHIVAMRESGGLRHFLRSNVDDTWSTTPLIVDSTEGTNFVGQYVSMTVESTDKVRIVYYDATAKDVKHAYFDGAAWNSDQLAAGGDIGEYCSVAIDSGNYMRVSWYNAGTADLVYRSSVDDSMTTIDSGGDVGKWTSIAVDDNDWVHISYYDESNGDLKYATNAPSGTWSSETVDSTGTTGLFTSIAVTADGIPCITYYHDLGSGTSFDLWYAVKPLDSWLKKLMVPWAPKYAHVAVDGSGYANIVYPGKFLKDGP